MQASSTRFPPTPLGRGKSSAVLWAVKWWRNPRGDHDGARLIAEPVGRVPRVYAKVACRRCSGSLPLTNRVTIATYGAQALTDAVVCVIPHKNLRRLSKEHPEIGMQLAAIVSQDRNLAYDH